MLSNKGMPTEHHIDHVNLFHDMMKKRDTQLLMLLDNHHLATGLVAQVRSKDLRRALPSSVADRQAM